LTLLIPLNADADDNDFGGDGCNVSENGGDSLFICVVTQGPKGKLKIKHE
jgi:hypothetical protein